MSQNPSLAALRATLSYTEEMPQSNRLGIASILIAAAGAALMPVPFLSPGLGLVGGCLGILGLASRKHKIKSKRVAVAGLLLSIAVAAMGCAVTASIVYAWNHVRPCNEKFDPEYDPADNYACLRGQHP
jgi:hypothetical protein